MNTRNCMDRLDMSIIFLFLNISLFGQVSYNCSNAIEVCDNEIITISYKRGEILNLVPDSLENACGTLGYIDFEYHFKNAVWLKYQFESNGKFIFKITPEDPYTDLDFAVFESNNNDCTNLEAARCMFSGINLAFPEDSEICLGETGLSENATDFTEWPGCDFQDDNFLAPVDVEYGDVLFLTISHWTAPDTVRYTIETNGTSVIGCLPLNTMNNEAIKTKIYPNPFVDLLTIETNNNSGYKSLEIWDSVGKKVFEEKMDGFEQVDLNRLKKGLYFLRILNNDQLIFQKKLSKL